MNTAYGFAGMGGNNTTIAQNMTIPQNTSIEKPQDLKNATDSDQDIIMVQHLIEFDAVQLQSENKLFIRETLIFRNIGTKDFYGSLKTWVPEGSEKIKVSKSEMMTGGGLTPLDFNTNGNIISWKEFVEQNSKLPLLYAVEYAVAMEPGATSITGTYSKKLAYPTLLNYRYREQPGLPALVVKIAKPQESSIKLFDEKRNEIKPDEMDETGEIKRFSDPRFKELNIEISGASAIPAIKKDYVVYIVLGILIVLVLLYPIIKKKLKPGENDENEEEEEEETSSPAEDEPQEEISESDDSPAGSVKEFDGKSGDELGSIRKGLLQELKELETEYKSGELLDEEYEDKKNSIQNKLKKTKQQ